MIIRIEYKSCWTDANRIGYVNDLNNNHVYIYLG